ncbi:hypothetical protein [Streptomyces sp. CBMA123]|uniref:hypothetical protein n=1 Tax=Streptomyces sp. CBMA123 TaxID=1896313 RepID=UPI001661F598|nr:hypothetical protein [Streptomyces sp. CBMA123]MBD0689530.1 hypothetical protein [Streptomyces sp. CBMA123]
MTAQGESWAFGCAECYGEDAQAVWARQREGFAYEAAVVADPHFAVSVRRCLACAQRFGWIRTEFTDWSGGDDASYLTVLPLTGREATALAVGTLAPLDLGPLGEGRRHLHHDRPSGGPDRLHWATGPFPVEEGH